MSRGSVDYTCEGCSPAAEDTGVDHTGGLLRETLLGFKRASLRDVQRLQGPPPPITVEILHASDECRLLRLSTGSTAHLDAVIITPDGGLECARELSKELGDGLERAYAACLALRGRCAFVYIQQLWVQDSFRSRGYGTALMKFFLGENGISFIPAAGFVALCAQPEGYFIDSHGRNNLYTFYERLEFVRLDESVSIMYRLGGGPCTTS